MQKSNKINIMRIILLISIFFVIPNLLISIQGNNENPIKKKNPGDIDNIQPPQVSSVYYEDTTGYAHGVYVSGDYAYIAAGSSGLAVIDISDPTNPGTPIYETTPNAYDVYISGDYAYVATYSSGLAVIDISDPTNPGTPIYKTTTNAYDVYVSGDYAYIADGLGGLKVIDISDPTNPGTPVYEATLGRAWGIYVSGDYAYVADGSSGLAVIDISDPTNPGTPVYEDTSGSAEEIFVSGDYAYIADWGSGLAVIDISDPTNPGTPVYENTLGSAQDIYVSGDYAYVADGTSDLAVIDISDPTNPGTPIYQAIGGGYACDVYVSGDYAYVASGDAGLVVVDISEPINPGTPIYENTTGSSRDVYISGDYAYMADRTSGLAVIDISDPTNPGTPVYEATTGNAWGVYVSGDYAYVASWDSGLAIIDISDPTNPGTPVYEATTGDARDVYVSGDYAYVADSASGLAVIDISDPTNPGTPVYENTNGNANGVYVSGDYAYVADYSSGLAVIDISNPTNPGTPLYEDTIGEAWEICVSGNYAYIADSGSGLAVIDISDPTNPGIPVYENTGGAAWGVYVSGDYAYVAALDAGLAVIDISDPTNPGTPTFESTAGYAYNIYVSGDYAYIADGNSGLAVIQVRKRVDMVDPIISIAPGDVTVEMGYSGQSLSWTANDANPDTYTIELLGTGIVAGPTAWISGNSINYNIPNGLSVGSYIYTVNFIDLGGNFITDSVTFTVEDTTNPTIISNPSDLTVEMGYTALSISWTATDANPNTYKIELQGTGIVTGPTGWTSGNSINYNIPDGFGVGSYIYIVNFTDNYGYFITDSVTFTVEDTSNPVISVSPNNFTVEHGYSGQSISWTATDANPNTYTIELQGTGIVTGPISWTSGVLITYNIPDGFGEGVYLYTVNFTDDYGNSISDIITFTVEDKVNPIIISAQGDLTVEMGYTGQNISWTATDANPSTYTIELQGTGIVAGPTVWTSGVSIAYNIPDGFVEGVYVYTINFTDDYGNSIPDSVIFTVEDTTNPTIISIPIDLAVEIGYAGQNISWTATDANPDTYTIELQGSGIVAGPITWTSGVAIIYDIPDGFAVGVYVYTVNFTDEGGNYIIENVIFTVVDTSTSVDTPVGAVPFGSTFLLITILSIIGLIFTKKRHIVRKSL